MNRSLFLGPGLAAAAALALMPNVEGRSMIEPRRIEVGPKISREERKRRRRWPRTGRPEAVAARAYVAHERNGGAPLCRPGWSLPYGPHRFAINEPVMCNDCQRRRWELDQKKRLAA
jgi:hypothetical protein